MQTRLNLPDLPTDLFLSVTSYLEPVDIVRCRQVSKLWHREFTDESFLRHVLVREYGEAQEVRALLGLEAEPIIDRSSEDEHGQLNDAWRRTFDRIIARKRALRSGRPRIVTKHHLRGNLTESSDIQAKIQDRHIPVFQWNRYCRAPHVRMHEDLEGGAFIEQQVPTDLLETKWTYDSGLLVYPDTIGVQAYIMLDIEHDTLSIVPFDIQDRIVRRLRLKHNLLIFEWAEEKPYHMLNELEEVHRHFVTVFDIQSTTDSFPWLSRWKITFRSEWKLHYLGFPLFAQDCWFSDHSKTHYAIYIWQTNRSAWGENEPIESLLIWDISQPSSHQPSSGKRSGGSQASVGPRLVKKLSYLDLDFLTIRQRETPFLRRITVDGSACVYFFEEGCVRERGSHVGHGYEAGRSNPRDSVWERIVGIPVMGPGPRWEDRCGKGSTFTGEWQHTPYQSSDPLMPKKARCWRYDRMGSGIRNQVVRDESASINYCVVQRTVGFPELWVSPDSQDWCTEIDLQGFQWRWYQINGDERYLLIQSDEDLHILHFDVDFGAKKEKGRLFLAKPGE